MTQYSCTIKVNSHLETITKTNLSRNYLNIETLNFVAGYIFDELTKYCDTVYYQTFMVNGKEYKNVIGSVCTNKPDRIIIGAHYDVAGEQEGADDNASGVTGILELARLLSKQKLNSRIDFVAYCLEEPPFFKTNNMGSYVHAKWLHDNKIKVKGMICLEMIGYFNDTIGSQDYPFGFLKLFYGNKGDFITVVQKFVKTKSFKSPKWLPGVDFSDHSNYWKFGYSAVMITNTAFYRNKNYHLPTDTKETLDVKRMCLVIDELYLSLKENLN